MTQRFCRNREGFALIITVVLVAFLVLILVGLATFTRVETQVAGNTADVAKARQNAMEGLNIALGQLQRHAGIDQATTARGDLFGHNDKRKNLTSVWSSIGGGAWTERAWLVSGSEPSESLSNTLADVDDPTGTEDNTNYTNVFLVGDKTVDVPADRILVRRQPIETEASNIPGLTGSTQTKIGHYAYWVGDEGAKVSLNVINPTRLAAPLPNYDGGTMADWTDGPTRERLNQQTLPQPQLANLNSNLSGIDVTAAATVEQLAKIESNPSLSFVAGFPAANQSQRIRELFHDVTPRAEAVLANLTSGDGRLKQSLGAATREPGTSTIKDYVNLSLASSTDYTTTHDVSPASFPVITEASIRLSFYRSGGAIHLGYLIDVEMWNPYASSLHYKANGDDTKDTGETDVITVEVVGLPQVSLTTNGTTPTTVPNFNLDTRLDTGVLTNANVDSAGGDLVWAPGQFKVLSTQGGDMLLETSSPSAREAAWSQPLPGSDDSTEIEVTYGQLLNTLEFRLKIGTTTVSTYKPTKTFNSGTTNTGATAKDQFALGYGIQFVNDLGHFAKDEDPRQSNLPNDCFENLTWDSDPTLNANTTFASTDDFHYEAGTQKQWVLFDLRRQEIVSVGQLRHLIGNTPYRAADGLYDDYFFATTPATPWTVDDIATQPLPNRYLRVIKPVQLQPTATDVTNDLRDGDNSARYLLQTAAFNINSTSIPAWSSLLGAKINGWTYDPSGTSSENLNHAFFRFGHGGQTLTEAPMVTANIGSATDVLYTAGRELSAAEVTALATQIVAQSKIWVAANNRPFNSIQDFINSGVVRLALAATTINNGLAAEREGTPGELTQEDVIASIAPMITPRTDTFKIRSYGDVYNPVTGVVTSRAWCEAVVQRVPDIAEDLNLPADGGAAGENVSDPDFSKYPFGRKFIIVSFRWLSPDDI